VFWTIIYPPSSAMHEIQQVFKHRMACPHIFSLLDKFLQHRYVLWKTQKTNMQVGQHLVWYINSISTHDAEVSNPIPTEQKYHKSHFSTLRQGPKWVLIQYIYCWSSIHCYITSLIWKKKKHQHTSKCTICMTAGTHFVFSGIKQRHWVIFPSILITNKVIENSLLWQELGV